MKKARAQGAGEERERGQQLDRTPHTPHPPTPSISPLGRLKHTYAERGHDCYETPACAVEALLRAERIPHFVWEPANGRGAITRVLRAHGHQVLASDLNDYGDPTCFARRDFLLEPLPAKVQCIVSNPPFKLAAEFAAHALDLACLTILLLPLQFLEAGTGNTAKARLRRYVLDEHPPARIHVFADRLPMMHRDGWTGRRARSAKAFGWYVWDAKRSGPTALDRIWSRVTT